MKEAPVVDWAELTVATYAALVHDRIHFAQAAYRDGEWYCMLGFSGGNCNGEDYHPTLRAALLRTLTEPVGQWCVFWYPHPKLGRPARDGAVKWLAENKPDVRWIPDRPVGAANELGLAAPFWRACRTRRVVLVGPAHLSRLDLFPVAHHIQTPDGTAWQHVGRICDEVRAVMEPDDLVLFASGMATNLMIWELWPEVRGTVTLYDIGSALDPYCGVFSRRTFRERGWKETIMPRNRP